MADNKHTETPWYAVNYAGYLTIQTTPMYATSKHDLLNMDTCEDAEANAERIVHCCNNFEEVVEALAMAKGMMVNKGIFNSHDPMSGKLIDEALKNAQQ